MPIKYNNFKVLVPILIAASLVVAPEYSAAHNYKPTDGYVQSADVAIEIAEAVLKSIYGEKLIISERPFTATLTQEGVWIVKGSLKKNKKGGVAEIWISKDNGAIIKVTHEL